MADERDRWLDKAAADRLLRGEPAAPGAEHHARARSERLRAALEALAEPPPAASGGLPGELRGEAAAVAAFRARGSVLQAEPQTRSPDAALFGSADTVVELGPPAGPAGQRSRRGRPVRFALAAAVASVAVGGLAAAAGTGLLDRDARDSAGGVPAVSVSVGSSSGASGDGGYATPFAPLRTTEPQGGEGPSGSPSPGNTPGTDGRTTTGPDGVAGAIGGTGTEPSANGSAGSRDGRDRSLQGGTDGKTTGPGDRDRDRDREGRTGPVELCRDYRSGRIDEAGREKLVRLAKGLLRVPRYCQVVLDVATGGGSGADAPGSPPGPGSSPGAESPSRSLELVPAGTAPPKLPDAGSHR
ncbi:hypothetical protein [Streptomyces sp. AP-93]|uniref:hypothetical protein n=1 Tax=Streptomyces sp. AP-93 TaxID=2929048 RepID=UPI001FAEDEB0|nr:hypothetical protein [Streptomyces sp. AP-93]MCJ0870295.1 hypothetical protein [Streptomyces sp. AP-93]